MPAKATYSAGTAFISVVPSFNGVEEAFKKQVRDMAAAADKDLSSAVARGLKEANREARGAGAKAGQDFGGAYEREVKKHLTAAWKGLPTPDPDVKLTKWEKALAGVRSNMKELSEQRIGIDIDKKTFDKAVADARKDLTDLRTFAAGPNRERNFFDANQAIGHLDALQGFSTDVERRAGEAGSQAGSAFNQRMAKALRDGLSQIPPMKITADSSDAERTLAEVQRRMLDLQSKRIGVDVDAGAAYAELKAIYEVLQKLDRNTVQIDVRTNAHEAGVGMGQFIKQAEDAGRATEDIGAKSNFSMSRLQYLIALGASLGTSIVPAAMAAASAIGFIGTAAAAGLSGLGVFALGVSGVSDAVKALDGYQKDTAKSANSVNQANRRMSGTTDQVRMAQQGLANARRKVAEGEADAARRVAAAERDVAGARHSAQVDLVQAAQSVKDAQRDVTNAERDAKDVRQSLNDAIAEATRNMRDLDVELDRNHVDQQKAVTAQIKALNELNALKMNPRASEVELRQAQDSYDEQTVRLEELKGKQEDLAAAKAKQDKLGIEGDSKLIAARKRVADADEQLVKAREKLQREQAQKREVEYQAQKKIADAQSKVGDAQREQTRQHKDGQYQLAQASNAVAQATLSQAQAYEKVGIAGGAALSNLNWQMSQLSPAAQDFAKFLYGLKGTLSDIQQSAAEPLLPDLQTAITMLLPYLPAVEAFIGKIADKLGDLAIGAVKAFGDPVWQRFFSYIDKTAAPSLQTMFEVGENLTQGLISLFLALTPFNDDIGKGLVNLSRDFAQWAERLNKTQGYQDFLDYVRENGPRVVEFLGEMGQLLINLVKAAAPLGAVMLRVLDGVAGFFNAWDPAALTALVWAIGAISVAFLTLGAVMRVVKLKRELTDIFGPKASSLVKKYAIETERATEKTGKFGKATATASGIAAAAGGKVQTLSNSVKGLGGKLAEASTGAGPLGKNLDKVRVAAFNAATTLNGPGGMAGAAKAAKDHMAGLGAAAELTVKNGLDKVKGAAMDVAVAANGPGGLAAGTQVAGGKLAGFGDKAKAAGAKLGGLKAVGADLFELMGGPWGAALILGGAMLDKYSEQQADHQRRTEDLAAALGQLRDTYTQLTKQGKSAADAQREAFQSVIENSPAMKDAVVTLSKLGVSYEDIMKASLGGDPAGPIKALNTEIARTDDLMVHAKSNNTWWGLITGGNDENGKEFSRLEERRKQLVAQRDVFLDNARKMGLAAEAEKVLNDIDKRNAAITEIKNKHQKEGNDVLRESIAAYDEYTQKIDHLNSFLAAFETGQGDVTSKAQALRDIINDQTKSLNAADDAADSYAGKLLDLKDALEQNGTSMDRNTRAGQGNRTAIKQAADAAREMWIQDVASGMPMDKATERHTKRIEALKKEAERGTNNKKAVDALVTSYGEIPPSVITMLDTKNFSAVYKQLQQMRFMQFQLEQGKSDKEALAAWREEQQAMARAQAHGWGGGFAIPTKATGGPIVGPGTGTSDDVLIAASDGEHMLTDAEVKAAGGHEQIYAWRRYILDGGQLPGYRHGGEIRKEGLPAYAKGGAVATWPYAVNAIHAKVPTKAEVMAALDGLIGGGGGGQGYQWQMSVLRQQFPWIDLFSGPRPGARTLSGGLSWHARPNKAGVIGRAVDVNPAREIAAWISSHYGKDTKELITPWPELGIWMGKKHHFSDDVQAQHDGRTSVRHVHWAYDEGGWLPPGANQVVNMTGQPEAVLNPGQWQTIQDFVSQGMSADGGGATYQFDFKDHTLTPAHLRSIQQRENAMARAGRPR